MQPVAALILCRKRSDAAGERLFDDGQGLFDQAPVAAQYIATLHFDPVPARRERQRQARRAPSRQRRLLCNHLLQDLFGLIAQPGLGAVLDLARRGLRRQRQIQRIAFAQRLLIPGAEYKAQAAAQISEGGAVVPAAGGFKCAGFEPQRNLRATPSWTHAGTP